MRRLHRLSDYSNKIFVRGIQVSFVPELGREWFEGLSRVVLSVVEAAIYEPLRPTPQRNEEGGYSEGGGDDGKLGFLPGKGAQEPLHHRDATRVHERERRSECDVYQREVYEEIYVVETIL